MCGYHVPDPVRNAIERHLKKDLTSTAAIAGQLHNYDFAVAIDNRMGVVEQVKETYYETHSEELYTVVDEPLSDGALSAALENA